jgi:formate dehydrogenase iron-sulfur subunit
MTPRLYIPRDAGAVAVGADEVAAALAAAAPAALASVASGQRGNFI